MRLPSLSFAVLDTETTGFVPRVHRIIEFASMRVEGGKVTQEYEHLYAGGDDIPPHIQVLTRIKQDALAGKPALSELREDILRQIDGVDLLVGQNLGFDLGMLKGEGIDLTDRPWIDTSLLASLLFPELRSYSLQYLSKTLKLHHEPVHRALGDVRATLELFGKIWERLCDLPGRMRDQAKEIFGKSSTGYTLLANALPGSATQLSGTWTFPPRAERQEKVQADIPLPPPADGSLTLHVEPLDCAHAQGVLNAAARDSARRHVIAVKNLEASLRRLHLPEGAVVLYPPFLLLDPDAAKRFLAQASFTADEATLAVKLAWFSPRTRGDIAVHGGEKDVWNGKLACTETSETYRAQFTQTANAYLLDHRQLLQMIADASSPGSALLSGKAHVIVDDASMLEDTATRAYGHIVSFDDLRAAAQGNPALMSFVDIAFLWAEKTRREADTHFVTADDCASPETKGLRTRLRELLEDGSTAPKLREQLSELAWLLDPAANVDLTWIERRINGALSIQSAPEHVDALLAARLYGKFPTTLLVPAGTDAFPGTIPAATKRTVAPADLPYPAGLNINFPLRSFASYFTDPLPSKTVILAPSKHSIEKVFIEHTEALEAKGITLICQSFSGGMNRMEAEFLASSQAILVLTPWMYEGSELPEGSVEHLVIDTLPFDHPGQPIFARRKDRFADGFAEYAIPRLRHRIFRLVRTFCRHRTSTGDIHIIDKRLREKSYGKTLITYVETLTGTSAPAEQKIPTPKKSSPKKKAAKTPSSQQSLF